MSRAIWRTGGAGVGSKFDTPPYIYDEVNDEFTDTVTGQKFSKTTGPLKLEDNKTATITANGTSAIEPTEGKDAMKKVTVTVDVPIKEEVTGTATVTTNTDTEIVPPEGATFSKVTVTTNVTGGAEIEANVTKTIDVTQYTEPVVITHATGKDGMAKATVTLSNIPPEVDLEANKAATIDVSQYTEPVEVTPTEGKDGMEKVTVTLSNIPPEAELETNKAETIDVSQYTEPVEVTPTEGKDGMEKVTVTLSNIPSGAVLEENKVATIDVSQYTEPVEVTPTTGKDGMEKVTVTLSNIPSGGDIDTSTWKVYTGLINTTPAVFLVSSEIINTGVYDVYVATYDDTVYGYTTLTHIANQTWTVVEDTLKEEESTVYYKATLLDIAASKEYNIRVRSEDA